MWPTEYLIAAPEQTKEALAESVNSTLGELGLDWSYDRKNFTGVGVSKGNVWSRAARRKKKLQELSTTEPSTNSAKTTASVSSPLPSTEEPVQEMVFRISIADGSVTLRWLKGVNDVLWDSFCGMMRRKLTGNVATVKKVIQEIELGGKKDESSGKDTWKEKENEIEEGQ